MNAERAQELMALHGTVEGAQLYPSYEYWMESSDGKPTFSLPDRLDHWVIKPWFSRKKADFEKAIVDAADTYHNNIEDDLELDGLDD